MSCVRTEPASPLVSILCGVLGAVVVVFLVIVVTMKVGSSYVIQYHQHLILNTPRPRQNFTHLNNIMCCVIWKNAWMRLVMLEGGWKK